MRSSTSCSTARIGRDVLPPLLVTFGLSIIIQNGLLEVFSADSQRLKAGAIETASISLGGGIALGTMQLLTLASAIGVILALNLIFYRTELGRAFRATSDDPEIAQLMGIDNRHIFSLATAIAMVVIAVSALYLGMRANFDPTIGPARLLYAFEAVIIGGLGSLWGTLAGGIIIGVAQAVGAKIDPEWQILAGHLAFLAVLVLRPRGLFPAPASEACMDLRRQIVVWRDRLLSGRVAVHVLDRATQVKLASLALRQARRRSERMLDAGLRHAQTQSDPALWLRSGVQAKTWRERSSQVRCRALGTAAAAASARNAPVARGTACSAGQGRWRAGAAVARRKEATRGGRYRIEVAHAALAPHRPCRRRPRGAAGRAACIRRPRPAQRSDLRAHHAGAGAVLEPAGRLCGPRLGGPAGLRRPRRLSAVRADPARRARSARCHPARRAAGGCAGSPTALVVFRLSGAYFAIGTWVMAEVYRLVFAQFKQLGGGTGTSLPPFVTNEVAGIQWVKALLDVRTPAARDIITYWVALAFAVGTILLVYLILRSRHGLALAAIRDSEAAAESVGVDNFKTKLWVYVVTAAATGMVGALIYLQKARISPDAAFSVLDWTAYVIFIVVIGGIGTIEGPIVGVLVFSTSCRPTLRISARGISFCSGSLPSWSCCLPPRAHLGLLVFGALRPDGVSDQPTAGRRERQ